MTRTSGTSSGRHRPLDRGSALVEFALMLPVLLVVLLGAIDFGRVSYAAMALTNGARAGVQYGAQSVGHSSQIDLMRTAAINSTSLDLPGVVATAGQRCECDGTVITCTASCGGARRIYVTVTTTKDFYTITQFPGFPHSLSLIRSATLRVQ